LFGPFRATPPTSPATQGVALGWHVWPLRGEKHGIRDNQTDGTIASADLPNSKVVLSKTNKLIYFFKRPK
jgi:hypothetical protein